LKFVVHIINSKIVKSKIVKLTRREKDDVVDTDVTMSSMILLVQAIAVTLVVERKKSI
jgi:hypothetical protein